MAVLTIATQFFLQIAVIRRPRMRRETSRVSFLMCPFCVRHAYSNKATATVRRRSVACPKRSAGFGVLPLALQVDAELA
jgi:hypothetical protein